MAYKIENYSQVKIEKEVKVQKAEPEYRNLVHYEDPEYNKLEF